MGKIQKGGAKIKTVQLQNLWEFSSSEYSTKMTENLRLPSWELDARKTELQKQNSPALKSHRVQN